MKTDDQKTPLLITLLKNFRYKGILASIGASKF